MKKFSSLIILPTLFIIGSVFAVKETVEHGSHGAEKHRPLHYKGSHHNAAFDLEALLASREHEDLADLDDDVRKNRLTVLAKSHDINKNGVIESEELLNWVIESFKILDHLEADETRKDEDDDQDGKITFEEILKKRYGFSQEEVEELERKKNTDSGEEEDKEVLDMVGEDKKRFETADLNKDGSLDSEEFMAFYQPYDYPHMHGLEMEKAMQEHDKNKDGFIQVDEFVSAKPEEDEERASEMSNFERLDQDKDGRLTVDEFKAWVLLDHKDLAQDEVEHLLKECDEDQNGHLTIEEIVNKEEEFLSSQATDYGRHLHFVRDEL